MKDILYIYLSIIVLASCGIASTSSVNDDACTTNAHLITSLPYWKTGDTLPCMYSGTLKSNTSEAVDHNMFYWFFRNTTLTDPDTPLILWINGGPGSSSMYGLFLENGPLRITRLGTGVDDYQIGLTPQGSWADIGHIIFLDQPVGTGFSYGTPYLDRLDNGTWEIIEFMKQFKILYPEFRTTKLILSGESYAGKYLPQLCARASLYDGRLNDLDVPTDQKQFMNTHAVLIGDPFNSPIRQRTKTHLVGQGANIVDSAMKNQVAQLRRNCEKGISSNWNDGPEACTQTMDYVVDMGGSINSYDVSMFNYDWDPKKKALTDFLTISGKVNDIYTAIHIDKSTKVPKFELSSSEVAGNYTFEEMLDWSYWYDECIAWGNNVLMYSGEYDQRDGPLTQEEWLKRINQFDFSDPKVFWNQARKIYYVKNNEGNYEVGGYYREDLTQKFTLLTVPKAGHFVPATQLMVTKQFLQDYITNSSLICHKDKATDCETGPIMCGYMSSCSNQGTCSNTTGKCTCNSGFKGADCSEQVEKLIDGYSQTFSSNGTAWKYFQFSDNLLPNQDYTLTISASNPSDIFLSTGDNEPTEFQNDMEIRQKSYIILSSTSFPALTKFVLGVRVNGVQLNGNIFYQSQLRVAFTLTPVTAPQSVTLEKPAQETNFLSKLQQQVASFWTYCFGGKY